MLNAQMQAEENYKSALEVDSQDIGTQEAVKSLRSVRSHMRAGKIHTLKHRNVNPMDAGTCVLMYLILYLFIKCC